MIRNIIFDWSGTLVDDLPAVWKASNHVFRQAGIPELSLETFRAEFCLPFKLFYDRFTPNVPMAQLEEWFHSSYREIQDSVAELPHARAFLDLCRERGARCFVLSSLHRTHFQTQAELTGFGAYMERPYVEALDKKEVIHRLLKENGLSPEETLFIGDMQHDIETAKHGGVFSCGVLTGYNATDQLKAAGPDLIVEHLGELRAILSHQGWELAPGAAPVVEKEQFPIPTVGALIFNPEGDVLMIQTHKWSNLWGIPGGKIKYGETSEEALIREIKEETDLDISDIRFILAQDCVESAEFYRRAHFVLLNYTCQAELWRHAKLNHEAQNFRWVSPSETLAMPLNKPTRTLVEQVLKEKT